MRRASTRPYVFASIVVGVILVIGTVVLVLQNNATSKPTMTDTSTGRAISSQQSNVSNTTKSTATTSSTKGTHKVTFQQLGACSPPFWGIPWSVTIGNETEVQPAGTPLPISNSTLFGTSDKNLTVIAFGLPDGTYHYRVSPSNFFFTPDSGVVSVNGSNVTVQIAYTGTSCVSTSTSTISTQSGGLLVRLELNSSRIVSGATVGINVSDYNPSPMELNLSREAAWALDSLSTGGCPSLYYPFGIAVFQGRYTSENVSQAVPLRIFPVVPCPMVVRYITGYLFQPMSDNATVLPGTGKVPMATGVSVSGTYNTAGNQLNGLTPFSPGTYTVVAGDEWGNLAFAYFVVVASS